MLGFEIRMHGRMVAAVALTLLAMAAPARAQVAPAAGFTPPDDTPSIKVGATIFADYTFQSKPKIKDADGNEVSGNAFNVARTYINITGNISHRIAFRITPDITRESGTGSSLNGSYTFRLKYGFAQFNLDDWMIKGSWIRFGLQQTPYIDYAESVYRYRFQGPTFTDREGYVSSSDLGASFHTNFSGNYGDLHAGIYNGETYSKPEANDKKSFEVRGTVRPMPMSPVMRGLRLTAFYKADAYLKDGERRRFVGHIAFEHKNLNAGFEYLDAADQTRATVAKVDGTGWSLWVTPRSTAGWEGLFRYDHLEPNADVPGKKDRTIAGVAYWFPHQGNVSTSLLLDWEHVKYNDFSPSRPTEQRIAVHGLVNF